MLKYSGIYHILINAYLWQSYILYKKSDAFYVN